MIVSTLEHAALIWLAINAVIVACAIWIGTRRP